MIPEVGPNMAIAPSLSIMFVASRIPVSGSPPVSATTVRISPHTVPPAALISPTPNSMASATILPNSPSSPVRGTSTPMVTSPRSAGSSSSGAVGASVGSGAGASSLASGAAAVASGASCSAGAAGPSPSSSLPHAAAITARASMAATSRSHLGVVGFILVPLLVVVDFTSFPFCG